MLGNTPEKREYNKWVLIYGADFLVIILGMLLRSIIIVVAGFVFLCLVIIPKSIIAQQKYYSLIFRRFRKGIDRMRGKYTETPVEEMQQRIAEQKEPKETPLLPLIGGTIIVVIFGSLYLAHRNAAIYPVIFRNVAIIGILVFIYGVYRYLKYR